MFPIFHLCLHTHIMIRTQWTVINIPLFWWLSFKLGMWFVPCDIKHSHIAQTLMAAKNLCNIQIYIYGNIRSVTRILDLGCFLSFLSVSKDKAIQAAFVCGHVSAPTRMSHSSCLATRWSQVCTAFCKASGTGWILTLFILQWQGALLVLLYRWGARGTESLACPGCTVEREGTRT